MLFANPNGSQGNVVSPGVNEFIIPNYKQTWVQSASSPTRRKMPAQVEFQEPGIPHGLTIFLAELTGAGVLRSIFRR